MSLRPPDPLPGPLADRFEVLALLGEGATGRAWAVRDPSGAEAVLKLFDPILEEEGDLAARFGDEAAALEVLDHPRFPALLEYGLAGEAPYLLMARAGGQPLDMVLLDRGTLDPAEVASLLQQAAEALDHLHGVGGVHRDLKPSNLMVGGPGGLVVIDLGLACVEGRKRVRTRTGQVLGTPEYCAPARILGREEDPRDDLYSLGVVAYQALAGENPFAGTSPVDTLNRHLSLVPPPPDRDRPGVPRGLALLVMDLLEKERADRPAGASEVLARLGSLDLPAEDIAVESQVEVPTEVRSAVPATPAGRAGPRERRDLLASPGLAAAALLGVGLGIGALLPPPTPPPVRSAAAALEATSVEWIPGDLADRIRRELRDADTRGALDPDPLRWAEVVASLPSLEAFLGWQARGGDPRALPEEVREELLDLGARFEGFDLPDPFHAALRARRASAPRRLGAGPVGAVVTRYLDMPDLEVQGWLAAAVTRAEALKQTLDAAPAREIWVNETREAIGRVVLGRDAGLRERWEFHAEDPDGRVTYARATGDVTRDLGEMLVALGRSFREEPRTREVAGIFAGNAFVELGAAWLGPLGSADPGWFLGDPAHPAAALAHATFAAMARRARYLHLPRPELFRGVLPELLRAARPATPGDDVGLSRQVMAQHRVVEALAGTREDFLLRWYLDREGPSLARMPWRRRRALAPPLVAAVGRAARPLVLSPEGAAWFLADAEEIHRQGLVPDAAARALPRLRARAARRGGAP